MSLPSVGLSGTDSSVVIVAVLSISGGTCGQDPGVELLRNRASVFGVMSWSAMGDAVTMVPNLAIGGG